VALLIQNFSRVLPLLEYGVSSLTAAGQTESGDLHLVKTIPGGTLLAAVDGAGHGREAAAIARLAISTLEAHACDGVISLTLRCHERLRGTRGAVMSLATINGVENTLTWLGVGNIEGILLRFGPSLNPTVESMLLRPGIVGYRLPTLQALVTPIAPGDLVILATDGVRADFARQFAFDAQPRKIAEYITSSFRKGLDDGLVLVARYMGSSE
jgi:phosphoserine phosphatase RsbX